MVIRYILINILIVQLKLFSIYLAFQLKIKDSSSLRRTEKMNMLYLLNNKKVILIIVTKLISYFDRIEVKTMICLVQDSILFFRN